MIGPLGDDDTITLSTASKKDQLPIVGYQSQSSVLADKVSSAVCTIVYFYVLIYHTTGTIMVTLHKFLQWKCRLTLLHFFPCSLPIHMSTEYPILRKHSTLPTEPTWPLTIGTKW